jgi:hypothetical protein
MMQPFLPSLPELKNKPDFEMALKRIYAWFEQAVIDRPPIRFTAHNADYAQARILEGRRWPDLKSRWFDAEYQVDSYRASIEGEIFLGETFPVFWPNLGPEIYAAFFGAELIFGEVTSYSVPIIQDWSGMETLCLDLNCEYFRKLEELTAIALDKANGWYLTGYTDLHGGVDIAAAWRDPQQFCIDLVTEPDKCRRLIELASRDFQKVYDHFDAILKSRGQLSITWMGIPSQGKLHIPSCDFASMISPTLYREFCHSRLVEEVKPMSHNIYHLDGKGVARHLDLILSVPEINAIQWVQGMGLDQPIMQWIPLLKRIRKAGKSLVIDLELDELEPFIEALRPEGILLCMSVDPSARPEILRRLEKWT